MPIFDGIMLGDTYVRPGASLNGIGTLESPYNSFAEANTLTGNQGGFTLFIRAGTVTRSALTIESASNFKVDSYGTGNYPMLKSLKVIRPVWRNEGNSIYSMVSDTNRQIWFNGLRCLGREDATISTLGNLESMFRDGRLYVKRTSGSPVGLTTEVNDSGLPYCLRLSGCSDVQVRHIHARAAWNNGILLDGCGDNILVEQCRADYCGNWGWEGGNDGIIVYGSDTTPARNVIIRANECNKNWNNAIEVWGLNSCIIENNIGRNNAKGIEYWGFCTGRSVARSNRFRNCIRPGDPGLGFGIWVTANDTAAPETGNHGSFTFINNEIIGCATTGIWIQHGINHVISGNKIRLSSESQSYSSCLQIDGTGVSASVTGNAFVNYLFSTQAQTNLPIVDGESGTRVTFSGNSYWTQNAAAVDHFSLGIHNGAYWTEFADWRAIDTTAQLVDAVPITPI